MGLKLNYELPSIFNTMHYGVPGKSPNCSKVKSFIFINHCHIIADTR